jgi:serine/threonine-protein kinase
VLPVIGETISHYKILSKLGEGGMGEVYLAEDESLAREVAIKVLPEAFTRDRERLARFEREARTLAALEHPNIAAIYGLEQVDGRQLLIMQLALGKTLAARLAGGPIPAGEAIPMALQIAEALEAAHETGIVHRDLKPANVVVTDEGRVKVLDFGLAKTLEPDSSSGLEPLLSESPTLANQMTEPGVVLGTRAYMSPEQARGKPVDKRTDIWSFGCLLFEMLSGQ